MAELTLSIPEAAAAVGISPAHAYRLAKAGRLPTIRFGGRTLVPRVQLERLLAGENASDPVAPTTGSLNESPTHSA